jgi:RNase H-like domain found in reverse transcriptase
LGSPCVAKAYAPKRRRSKPLKPSRPEELETITIHLGPCELLQAVHPASFRFTCALYSPNAQESQVVWSEECEQGLCKVKQLLSKHITLTFPDFNKPFKIYTDASTVQLGAIVEQEGKPLAFYSRKLSDAQTRYTVTELELLSIVETLQEYCKILLGHIIKVYTDHKNLTFDNFTTDRVRRWRIIAEEYGPEIIYIKGWTNEVADMLSRYHAPTK